MKTLYNPGDIVLCPMKFSDGVGGKFRPVIVLSQDRDDLLICAISTQIQQGGPLDLKIKKDIENNLRSEESIVRISKITTITSELVHKKWGKLSKNDWIHLKDNMLQFVSSW